MTSDLCKKMHEHSRDHPLSYISFQVPEGVRSIIFAFIGGINLKRDYLFTEISISTFMPCNQIKAIHEMFDITIYY